MPRKAVAGSMIESGEAAAYRAPALEKGLDILELLAAEAMPLTASAIVQRLGRSTGELFRMIQVLERRGFIAPAPDGQGYILTDRLFALAMDRPPVRNLIELALPVMRQLSLEAAQSCHLAIHSGGQIVVVARMESGEQLGFSVRIGYRRPLIATLSGAVLYAHQPTDVRAHWEDQITPRPSAAEFRAFRDRCKGIQGRSHVQAPSEFVPGVTDFSAPILRGDLAAAALTIPFVETKPLKVDAEAVGALLERAASDISGMLFRSDART